MNNTGDFSGLGITENIIDKLKESGITVPTPVQREAIPKVLQGLNLLVQSPTGTGKTLAYLAPLLSRLDPQDKQLRVIILVPSRELAAQIVGTAKTLAGGLRVAALLGGANPARQIQALKDKPQLAVGTPGRVLELLEKGKINGQVIDTIVVDEADKMFSRGFMEDVEAILKATLKTRQVLFFSATIPYQLREIAPQLMNDPQHLNLGDGNRVPESITHLYFMCGREQKTQTLAKLLKAYNPLRAIVFIQRNQGVEPLSGRIREFGIEAAALHSGLPQRLRREILEGFRLGKTQVLITTDLLARGMDIEGVDYIFNYDLPIDEKHYLHRAGRTGRAGRQGTAVTLVSEEQKNIIPRYARTLGIKFSQMGLAQGKIIPVDRPSRIRSKKQRAGIRR